MSEERQEDVEQTAEAQPPAAETEEYQEPPWLLDDAEGEDAEKPEEGEARSDAAQGEETPQEQVTAPPAAPAVSSELFSEAEMQTLQGALDSGDARQTIRAQQIIAQRTMRAERLADRARQSWYSELGVTPEFREEYGNDLDDAFMAAPPELRGTREGAALIVGAVVAQRALSGRKPLAEEFAQAATRMGYRFEAEQKPPRRAEAGLKAGTPDPRASATGAASGGSRRRMSVDEKLDALLRG